MLRKSEGTADWNQLLGGPQLSPSNLPTEPRSKLFQSQHSFSPRKLKGLGLNWFSEKNLNRDLSRQGGIGKVLLFYRKLKRRVTWF